jgi:uncharacterized lipoprotein YddW (UPF0748 family)/N-acetylmuramoyl-L-alanine amidase
LALTLFCGFLTVAAAEPADEEFRAVWVASVVNLDYPSEPGLSVAALKREADSLLNNAQDMGFNAVIFQVRPTGDALYASSVFPWSDVLTGEQGKDPGFDPLAYFIQGAHARGIELHAWLNPFRVARNTSNADGLSENNPARQNPEWTVAHSDGHLYYNPGIPEVRELLLSGVRELVKNYGIDGIHFDDYFYPGRDFQDDEAFAAYGGAFADRAEWRRSNVDSIIRETQRIAREAGVRFGVSPQAIWANRENNPLGSDTRGYETYYEQFADTRKWVLEELVDYIAPQIYWEIGRDGSDYSKVLAWWTDLVGVTDVDLYIGHATYLMNGGSSRDAWTGTGEIARQIAENRLHPEVKGDIHFRYGLIAGDRAIAESVKALYTEDTVPVSTGVVMPAPEHGILTVGRPAKDITFSGANYYFVGASDPDQPLTVNGTEINGRTSLGYFAYFAELKKGENVFIFRQDGAEVTRTITVPSGSTPTAPQPMGSPVIQPGVFPEIYDEIHPPGATVTLSCTAPVGASVTVRIGGDILPMKAAAVSKPNGGAHYPTRFTVSYTYPEVGANGNVPVVTLGTPVYTMTLDGKTMSRAATGSLKLSTKAECLVAEVSSAAAFVYPKASTSGGPVGELFGGQLDAVVSVQNGSWVELGCGLWVPRSDVRIRIGDRRLLGHVGGATYKAGEKWDTLTLQTDILTATSAVWNGKTLTFTVFSSDAAPPVTLPADSVIGKLEVIHSGNKSVYTLTPAAGLHLDGYYVESAPDGLRLCLKRKPLAGSGSTPLAGFTIVLDAGHGGSEPGALGAMGGAYPEKTVNLYAALKLRTALTDLGAKVVMTRNDDTDTTLQSRIGASRTYRPDLFLSLHCNAMDEDVNCDTIRGVSVFYREPGSAALAESLYDGLLATLGTGGKGFHQSNLYVCRGFWTPSVILEMGFLCNPFDYEWLTDDDAQNGLIHAVADGIVAYFR